MATHPRPNRRYDCAKSPIFDMGRYLWATTPRVASTSQIYHLKAQGLKSLTYGQVRAQVAKGKKVHCLFRDPYSRTQSAYWRKKPDNKVSFDKYVQDHAVWDRHVIPQSEVHVLDGLFPIYHLFEDYIHKVPRLANQTSLATKAAMPAEFGVGQFLHWFEDRFRNDIKIYNSLKSK